MSISHFCLPKGMTSQEFLSNYWQKKPLLIKQGLPQLAGMFEPDDIIGLALDEEAQARLITQNITKTNNEQPQSTQWTVKKSPLDDSDFQNLPKYWTVLVQNLEQWSPELGQLWHAFDFIPQWQRDDIMVSYAPKGGSVGKHYDDYDVFLAQGYGNRRWQLGKYCDENTEFVKDQPIRIFDDMGDIIFDDVLEPGDVLYVPPKLSHYGVAQNDCLTFSFGFRRPNPMQILDSLTDIATTEKSLFVPMMLEQTMQPAGKLEASSIAQIKQNLLDVLQSSLGDKLIKQAVSEVVSKRQYDILTPEETITIDELQQALTEGATIHPDYSSRLIYTQFDDELTIYANGLLLDDINCTQKQLLKRLADGEALTESDLFSDESMTVETVMTWLENGWVWLDF